MKKKSLQPAQIIALSFLSVIIIGALLLSLPIATTGAGRATLIDSVFTATSATCVTGLIVKDTGNFFSPFEVGYTLSDSGWGARDNDVLHHVCNSFRQKALYVTKQHNTE